MASAPGNAVLAVDDVILGAMAGSSGTVPLFTSDARKAFGAAIGDAEKTGAGTLRVKRWRAGTTTDENIPMTIMGDYTATAPYTCPKSALILANARNKLVSQLLANPNFLTNDWAGAISGLALLAGVAPGDPDYATVQTRLQTYARALATAGPQQIGSADLGLGLQRPVSRRVLPEHGRRQCAARHQQLHAQARPVPEHLWHLRSRPVAC